MNNIAEIVLADGEVVSLSELSSQKEFEYKVLNSLDFENIKSFFIKKTIIQAVKEKHNLSNGSNGLTTIELVNIFKFKDFEVYLEELQAKKIIKMKKGINLNMYFVFKNK